MSEIAFYIAKTLKNTPLSSAEAERALSIILSGRATPAQIAVFVYAATLFSPSASALSGMIKVFIHKIAHKPIKKHKVLEIIDDASIAAATSFVIASVLDENDLKIARYVENSSLMHKILSEFALPIVADCNIADSFLSNNGVCFLNRTFFSPPLRHISSLQSEFGINHILDTLIPFSNPYEPECYLIESNNQNVTNLLKASKKAYAIFQNDLIMVCKKNGSPETIKIKSYQKIQNPLKLTVKKMIFSEETESIKEVMIKSSAALFAIGKINSIEEGVAIVKDAIRSGRVLSKVRSAQISTKILDKTKK